ncbi:hypothetical protein ACOMHN_037135 [Nucella lapillus]
MGNKKKSESGIPLLLLSVTLLIASGAAQESLSCQESESVTGCTSKFLLPTRPFMVIWNEPSNRCEAHGINLNLSAWDIVENPNDAFGGDMMNIYYHLGDWPSLNHKTGKVVSNGGVPQQGNLTYHLQQAKAQILKSTKPDFDGVAVIDMELWRPIFGHNFDSLNVYQQVSRDIVKARYPHLNKTAVNLEATKEFDTGARLFMEGTLNLTRALRPLSHWGFYGFPRNWGASSSNEHLAYLWRASRGLFPRIYMNPASPFPSTKSYIQGQVKETLRLWAKFSAPDTLILPYSLCQTSGTNFFSVENLTLSVGLPGQMGAAGVVLWGSSGLFHTRNECQMLQKYVNTVLGPYVKNLTAFFSDCSAFYCSAHGRCVNKSLEMVVQRERIENRQKQCLNEKLLQEMMRGVGGGGGGGGGRVQVVDDPPLPPPPPPTPPHPYKDYVCRCLPGWTGQHCEKKACDVK